MNHNKTNRKKKIYNKHIYIYMYIYMINTWPSRRDYIALNESKSPLAEQHK